MNVSSWLKRTATLSSVARLDAELILARALKCDRVFLYAHPEFELNTETEESANSMLARREKHESLAYIFGEKEFYGRNFLVSPAVLVPRPESEAVIDLAKQLKPKTILDVGTGSGCLAVTLKLELPGATVDAVDLSSDALAIAKENAVRFGAAVSFFQSNLLSSVPNRKYDMIVANLPYVDRSWDWLSPELAYEPEIALYANDGGLDLIKKLVQSIEPYLSPCATLLLESDLCQHEQIRLFVEAHSLLRYRTTEGLIQAFSFSN